MEKPGCFVASAIRIILEYESQKALEYFSRALPIWQAVENELQEAIEQSLVSDAYAHVGKRQQALDHAEQAVRLVQAVGVDKT